MRMNLSQMMDLDSANMKTSADTIENIGLAALVTFYFIELLVLAGNHDARIDSLEEKCDSLQHQIDFMVE